MSGDPRRICRGPRFPGAVPVVARLLGLGQLEAAKAVDGLFRGVSAEMEPAARAQADHAVDVALAQGALDVAASLFLQSHLRHPSGVIGCGFDLTDLILAVPFDRATHEVVCPQCGCVTRITNIPMDVAIMAAALAEELRGFLGSNVVALSCHGAAERIAHQVGMPVPELAALLERRVTEILERSED